MEHLVEMSLDEWLDTYKPIPNHFTPHAAFDGTMFETFGEELEYINSISPEFIWTWIEGDGGSYIIDGRHFVNRLGYFVSEYARTNDKQFIEVTVETYGESEECFECGVEFDNNNPNIEGYCQTCRVALELDEEE